MPATVDYHVEQDSLDQEEREAVDQCASQLGAATTLIVKRDAEGELVIEVGRPERKPADR